MMDSGSVWNMQSTLSNKYENQCISLAFIIRIYKNNFNPVTQMHIQDL